MLRYQGRSSSKQLSAQNSISQQLALHSRYLGASKLATTLDYLLAHGTASFLHPHYHQTPLALHQLGVEHCARKLHKTFSPPYRQTFCGISSECTSPGPASRGNLQTIKVPASFLLGPGGSTHHGTYRTCSSVQQGRFRQCGQPRWLPHVLPQSVEIRTHQPTTAQILLIVSSSTTLGLRTTNAKPVSIHTDSCSTAQFYRKDYPSASAHKRPHLVWVVRRFDLLQNGMYPSQAHT